MPRRIIIHPGFHKTGSTAVQRFLRQNRVALQKYVALRFRWHMKDLVAGTREYSLARDPLKFSKVQALFMDVLNDLPSMPKRVLVLSCDDLLGHLPGKETVKDYSAAPELIYTFCEIAQERFPLTDVRIYLSTRSSQPWLASAYWEHVKSSDMTLDFQDFVAAHTAAAALDDTVAEIKARVPAPVHSRSLETSRQLPCGPADPLLDLCDTVPSDLRATLATEPLADFEADPIILERLLDVNRSTHGSARRKKLKAAILEQAGHS